MSDYRRNYCKGGTWFFTVNLHNRKSHLLTIHIAALRSAIAVVRREKPFDINAWVVLPEHMHSVWTLPADEYDFSSHWREIKKHFSKSLGLQKIWQPRFWEHTIRDHNDYQRHVEYIYINPVKHGWVKQVKDWPFSTFHRDVKNGVYPQDWAGEISELNTGERL
ncbi:REP-associated tyrosine transposase [Citrobacter tructae]|uniref:REP-associated tyrosine transposase n=1 Tax=Citrobacter tructae TaxID=2562449 RepID=UPI003F573227